MKNKFIKYFVYSIAGIILMYIVVTIGNTIKISNSEPFKIAKNYIENNQEINKQIGNIKKIGLFPSGAIKTVNGLEYAQIELFVEGNIKKSNIILMMEKNEGRWEIKEYYYND